MSSNTHTASAASTTWSKEAGYIWSLIGSAVGFANILSFSALCYKNGGGAFLIPYLLAHLLVGIPMLLLEAVIGQRSQLPLVAAMGQIGTSLGKTLGWFSVLACATIGGFYLVLTGFSVAYTYFAGVGAVTADSAFFFKHHFLQDTGSLLMIGGLAPKVFIATLLCALMAYFVLTRNVRTGIEKICTLFLPLLALSMLTLAISSAFLPGAFEGFKNYLLPDFAKLKSWELWRDVFGQVFFSLSLGLGIVTGYSRHNSAHFNLSKAMVKVALGDVIISFISGFAIFGCIGYMSQSSGVAIPDLVKSDSAFEIGFVIFPQILAHFGPLISKIVGPLFFFCIFIAGITGVFSIVESVAGNIEIEFKKQRKSAVTLALGIICILALPFCLGNGQHLLGALAPMLLGIAMLLGGIGQILLFLFFSKNFAQDPLWVQGKRKSLPFYLLRYFVLPLLTLSLLGALYKESLEFGFESGIRFGWFIGALLLAFFLSYRSKCKEIASAKSA